MCKGCQTGIDADYADKCYAIYEVCGGGRITVSRIEEPDRPYTQVGEDIPGPGAWLIEYNHSERSVRCVGAAEYTDDGFVKVP